MTNKIFKKQILAAAITSISYSGINYAQENQQPQIDVAPPRPQIEEIEEIVVTTRLKDSTTAIIQERMEQAYSAEILGVDQIVKAGDSNIASALRRVTGLSLIDGKYVYVRGLGERYSSTTLNGASVPSPELTRSVIPLDLYPTTILESVKVHKAYSADQPAAFGGGNIDIRTRGVPDQPVFSVSLGMGWDSNSGDNGLKLQGDGGGLPSSLDAAIDTYRGNISISSILRDIDLDGGQSSNAQDAEAKTINGQLLTSLNRNLDFSENSVDPDFGGSVSAGSSWFVTDDLTFGVLATYDQNTQVRNENRIERVSTAPTSNFDEIQKTVEEVNTTIALNFGLSYQDKHFIETNSFVLEIDEDQSRISRGFDSDTSADDGLQKLTYISRLEQREMTVNQIIGEHLLEDGDFPFLVIPEVFEGINVNWIYSDSSAETNIPNAVNIQAINDIDPVTFNVLNTRLRSNNNSAAEFSYLELEDSVESYGMHFEAPFSFGNFFGALSGGWLNTRKSREYYGYTANIGTGSTPNNALSGTPAQVLSDSNLSNLSNDFELTMGAAFGAESYVGAQLIEAGYGGVDITWNDTWRFSGGVRWESFRQGLLPIDLLDYEGDSLRAVIDELQQPDQQFVFTEDDYYPSLALTYLGDELLGSDTFQIRLGYGKTIVRPDLREKSSIPYIDPETYLQTIPNPNLQSSDINQLDLRVELFYPDGSNLTASIFYKDIQSPIETIGRLGGDDNKALTFINGESGEVYGIEFEGFKELGAGFFLNGNVTISDSETDFEEASQTNQTRPLTGHSEYVANAQLGYDSDDGYHSLSVAYNYFSERLYFGGQSPEPDAIEQPFHSLDLVYSFYPTYNLSIKTKIKNLLGEDIEIEQGSAVIIEQERGTSIGIDVKYDF